ncbi:hypothetical protein F4777DRAFT_583090 [Nemania sp. FL0916]|nr:hypothetical protein F4777DRAFT_583090 [Nemania sp. FL0916]
MSNTQQSHASRPQPEEDNYLGSSLGSESVLLPAGRRNSADDAQNVPYVPITYPERYGAYSTSLKMDNEYWERQHMGGGRGPYRYADSPNTFMGDVKYARRIWRQFPEKHHQHGQQRQQKRQRSASPVSRAARPPAGPPPPPPPPTPSTIINLRNPPRIVVAAGNNTAGDSIAGNNTVGNDIAGNHTTGTARARNAGTRGTGAASDGGNPGPSHPSQAIRSLPILGPPNPVQPLRAPVTDNTGSQLCADCSSMPGVVSCACIPRRLSN